VSYAPAAVWELAFGLKRRDLVKESTMIATEFIPVLVATLPVILSPIVVWALGRSRISKQSAMIDYVNKRLDFMERLNKLHTQLTEHTYPLSSGRLS
jgi:hypothetical protein